jgi:hypothetical protein
MTKLFLLLLDDVVGLSLLFVAVSAIFVKLLTLWRERVCGMSVMSRERLID